MIETFPIKWHEENIKSMKITLAQDFKALNRLKEQVAILENRIIFYEEQVEQAKKMKKKKFNADYFMRKRG